MVDGGQVLLAGFAALACWVEARGRPIVSGSGRVHSYWGRGSVVEAGGGSAWTSGYLVAARGRPISCGPGRRRVVGGSAGGEGIVVEAVVEVGSGFVG